ncbi:hypothetical protein MLD52_14510 [Puniceicoccaceae bacterium K14]|nr:hypothetical protein [Puniceicoccaceae bacterium K14]
MMSKTLFFLFVQICQLYLFAGWQLVDDFEDEDISDWSVDFSGEEYASELGSISVVDNPLGKCQGKVLRIDPSIAEGGISNMIAALRFPNEARIRGIDGRESSFYFRIGRPSVGGNPGVADFSFGLSAVESPSTFSDYAAYIRSNTKGEINVRDQCSFPWFVPVSTSPQDVDTYYQVWFVLDHWDNTYSVYLKGGVDFPVITEVVVNACYRKENYSDINTLMLITAGGESMVDGVLTSRGQDPIYVDDIYINTSYMDIWGLSRDCDGLLDSGNLVNISTRGRVGTQDDALIGGFVVEGQLNRKLLLQAVGMELEGVDNSLKLSDPQLRLVPMDSQDDESTHILNNDWGDESNSAEIIELGSEVGATVLEEGSTSSAMLLELSPGAYSVIVDSSTAGEGIVLLEVYDTK